MVGVTINGKHSYNDFGLILTSVNLPLPAPKRVLVDIPGSDGVADITEQIGSVKFNNRTITMTFAYHNVKEWQLRLYTAVATAWHGKNVHICFDDDPNYFYVGRIDSGSWEVNTYLGTITLTADCEPYKYGVSLTTSDWLWDPFNFELDTIRDYREIVVDGSKTVVIEGCRSDIVPTFISNAAFTFHLNGVRKRIFAGRTTSYDLYLHDGENQLTISGTGTLSVEFREKVL